jgi:predicted metal-dependent hydrolase
LRVLARLELPPRTRELASLHQLTVKAVHVRNQRSRWGSCSGRKTISLNWRLIQLPPEISDYIILHELAHLTFLNHSERFWAEVARLCPDYSAAEHWLKTHGERLL